MFFLSRPVTIHMNAVLSKNKNHEREKQCRPVDELPYNTTTFLWMIIVECVRRKQMSLPWKRHGILQRSPHGGNETQNPRPITGGVLPTNTKAHHRGCSSSDLTNTKAHHRGCSSYPGSATVFSSVLLMEETNDP